MRCNNFELIYKQRNTNFSMVQFVSRVGKPLITLSTPRATETGRIYQNHSHRIV